MKIIKLKNEGAKEKAHKHTCRYCQTVFTYTDSDTNTDVRGDHSITCPNKKCNHIIEVE